MFKHVTKTWNPIVGCKHLCTYCWAMRLANGKLRHLTQYRDGFDKPKLVMSAFSRKFKPGDFVFVSDMGDMWGNWVPRDWILRVLYYIRRYPRSTFLFLTKNPARYHEFLGDMPKNVVLGATIETNRDMLTAEISRAPPPSERYHAMRTLPWPRKLISMEPILDFDHEILLKWVLDIRPELVYIGYDNYNNRLREPSLEKTKRLIEDLLRHGIRVETKTLRPAWHERHISLFK